ncbi:MAG: tRNA (adenosine(37)-N6)-threonylcarbamoyltransferase complex ATPase subunit type 1 TsaE [Thermomicrobium sp.]|nr:tRNA (adenosine(37)-N6)-threonylcarbamoyltransferase complex ATPase subunit type 1 TsaE [Thermomicrobium sp.]MDW8060107.1 tRNA (adenosine(37)-N6)-threonylcarbamoyltransferase complex ATPase subunit type 1 TsaE [Thermomicrobium sp.]
MTQRVPALDLVSHSPDQTRQFAATLARHLRGGDVLLLQGPLGSGKTTFVQGLARGLGVREYVQSPTFILVMEHRGTLSDGTPIRLYHIDLYRLEEARELATFGLEDCLSDPAGITVIEWSERLPEHWVDEYLVVRFEPLADTKRRLAFFPVGERARELVEALRKEVVGGAKRSTAPGHRDG